jgi:hypothetical protein
METNERVSPEQASAALAAVRHSRAQVALGGYPAWYWVTTAACLAAVPATMLLPTWWVLPAAVLTSALLIAVTSAAARARGIRENCVRTALTPRDRAVLYGPAAVLMLASGAAYKAASWVPAAAAVLIFLLFAATGLILGTRASRA